jgi:hypothetical protein
MSLEHMLQDEREALRFLLGEAQREGEFSMNSEEIKAYVERMIERSERQSVSERTASFYDYQIELRRLYLQACQVEASEKQNELLQEIAFGIESLNPGR